VVTGGRLSGVKCPRHGIVVTVVSSDVADDNVTNANPYRLGKGGEVGEYPTGCLRLLCLDYIE
jgi:hypothetical protein